MTDIAAPLAGDPGDHPVALALRRAVRGEFPAVDGVVEVVPRWRAGLIGIVCFTGHALIAAAPGEPSDSTTDALPLPEDVRRRIDAFGGAHDPRVVAAFAGAGGWIDSLDVVLAARGVGGQPSLVARPDLVDHPRARHAAKVRDDVHCFSPPVGGGFLTLGTGLGGLPELGIELDEHLGPEIHGESAGAAGAGAPWSGREMISAALTLVPEGDVVVAAVAPGNARALRAFLAAGFSPVGGVQLIVP